MKIKLPNGNGVWESVLPNCPFYRHRPTKLHDFPIQTLICLAVNSQKEESESGHSLLVLLLILLIHYFGSSEKS
ncbi:hypothetical protein L2E82_12772 [Cichorium intybus]|uniref:Uncharacterized protein n=1 Tax=Cichorium intybus TaxID=13427 RepID=A0ACB9GI45_CICIN|nr:hypothetical protein L2E82_12772 [Cichorium intybus]